METKRPDLVNAVPPYGHVICSEKWRDSPLIQGLKDGDVRVLFEADLGVADLLLPGRSSVLFLSEAEVVGGGYRRRAVRYRAGGGLQQLVLVQRGPLSLQEFPGLQRFVVLDLGLALLPVAGATEAAQLIAQMVGV
ncbi:unnamed protein product [Menidia menidia]|uniref:(Atlantic silverside) hypothetical protein n=1 Tax=Menidia menidia TaxID=238744 RepID=A0A8S4BHU8_9TELE|nr:unnamed protein product [Menidia menidia]